MTPFIVDGPRSLSCEVLVIGTGAGGASIAAALTRAGVDVLMLEEGDYIPAASVPAGLAQSMLSMWRGAGLMSTLGKSQIAFAEGRCVGGGTEINSAIFQRAPDEVIEAWTIANHIADFSVDTLARYYDQAAEAVSASVTPGEPGAPTDILVRAGTAMGWKVSVLERAQRACVGTNLCSSGCPTGGKQSMTATLIPQAQARGARLVARCRVERLTRSRRRVTGAIAIATDVNGCRHRISVSAGTVFVCAGTIQTPALLHRSRLSPTAGRRFQVHPTIRVLARFRDPVNAHHYRLPLAAITELKPGLRFGGSMFTLPSFGIALAEDWNHRAPLLRDYAHYCMYYAMIKPDGIGRIWSAPGLADPVVTYRLTDRDWRRLQSGVADLAHALFAAGAEGIMPSVRGHPGWRAPEEIGNGLHSARPRSGMALFTIHLFGSCAIGEAPDIFATDSYGRVRGTENVFVGDASLLPGAPGVNPQATVMALAFRTADAFLASRH
jgi:choline dehydrogenase-like flavoprotein